MKIHELKCWPESFEAVMSERKRFDYRKYDRGFNVGDALHLRRWDPATENYQGGGCLCLVTYVINGPTFGVPEGYCVLSIVLLWPRDSRDLDREGDVLRGHP
jgi:hypothetical protein